MVQFRFRVLIVFFFCSCYVFSQKTVIKKFATAQNKIVIYTEGLDDFILENSNSNLVEVSLASENIDKQDILVGAKTYETSIHFKIPIPIEKEIIFRKFITERLQRATAKIKVPKNKAVTILGENINVTSKSYAGNLRVFLENGIVKLDTVQQNLELKLYTGSVFGCYKDANVKIASKKGNIKIDTVLYSKKYLNQQTKSTKEISISSVLANIYLSTHKTQ
ncbi:hypothetical protein [uncultured Polaribacter sp.]|uniref:hypothetical protein n=1 Tax=uncultured Polaribacter sp. TaxID=174711 RepID=UPI00262B9587|nr:hypothetical protein [uncultured Polaribacter sp.]